MTLQPYSTKSTDPWERWRTLVELATDCYALADHLGLPSEAEEGEHYAIAAGEEYRAVMARAALAEQPLPRPQLLSEVTDNKTVPVLGRFSLGRPPAGSITRSLPPPDALRTPAEAARKLRCSIKTLNGYVKAGALKYVIIGHGKRRPRKMFTDADLDAFIAAQTRKEVPCPSIATRAPRSGNTTSRGEVIAFSAQPKPRPSAKPKK